MAANRRNQTQAEPDRSERERPIVTKVSGEDLDQAIKRLSEATAPYFRSGGPLMPDKPS
jgi:hypothetical protein